MMYSGRSASASPILLADPHSQSPQLIPLSLSPGRPATWLLEDYSPPTDFRPPLETTPRNETRSTEGPSPFSTALTVVDSHALFSSHFL